MQSRISRRGFLRWFVIGLGGVFFPQMVLAGSNINVKELEDTDCFDLKCTIMEVHPEGSYLIVGEKKIELIDFQKGGRRYRTMLRDHRGQTIPFSSFTKGQWVFIRAFELLDGRSVAREIYKLPSMPTRRSEYPFFKEFPVWDPVE